MQRILNLFRRKKYKKPTEEKDNSDNDFFDNITNNLGKWDLFEDKIQEIIDNLLQDKISHWANEISEWKDRLHDAEKRSLELQNELLIEKEKRVESDNLVNEAKMVIAEKSLSSIPRENSNCREIKSNIDDERLNQHISETILANEGTNIKLLPDFVERKAWALALRQIMYGLSEIKIDLYGHTMRIYLEPDEKLENASE